MCEQPENSYLDGDVVWVKLGSCWWPGEVVGPEKLPPDVLPSFRKPPIAVVKFFQEDTYEYVKNTNSIYKYNCSRKNEFINKGLYMYRTKHGPMEKFPEDVIRAETAVGGDIKILTRDEFQEEKKESYAGLFGEPAKKTPVSSKKGKGGRGKPADSPDIATPIRKMKEKTIYKVHILVQGSKTTLNQSTDATSTASTSRAGSESAEEKPENTQHATTTISVSTPTTPTMSTSGIYSCHACPFTTTRLNVLIMHNKTHSVTFTPYTPSPVKKKITKLKNTPTSSKTPKIRKPKQEKKEEVNKNAHAQKRLSQEKPVENLIKKAKTDEEIKTSLLADWDDVDEESNDVSTMTMAGSPEVPVGAESPAVPTPAELPSAQIPGEMSSSPLHKKSEETPPADKPESSSDSKYEFCEDEDWSLEADAGRKIPRFKNPSKRKEELKSLSIDDDDVAKEVAELLNKTVVPELPSVPEPLKVEENFPELTIAKSPDKRNDPNLNEKSSEVNNSLEKKDVTEQPPKTIFKTKTFFRSRHSRSQDAIVKYVAEQLNAAERMDISESEINGTDVASSPEARESPPVEHIKVARLAPKIQLKRMKAEAAQQREKERYILEQNKEGTSNGTVSTSGVVAIIINDFTVEKNYTNELLTDRPMHAANSITRVNKITNDMSELDDIPGIKNISGTTLHCTSSIGKNDKRDEYMSKNLKEEVITELINTDKDTVCTEVEGNRTDNEINDFKNKKENDLQITEPSKESQATDTTATAVDALLSVSREADSVTKVISDDPPEDLFEDDIKDNAVVSNENGYNEINKKSDNKNEELFQENIHEYKDMKTESLLEITVEQNINSDNLTNIAENVENKDDSLMKYEQQNNITQIVADSAPTESDLQIAEALINLPSTAIQNKAFSEQQDITPTIEINPLTKTPVNEMLLGENVVKSDEIKDVLIKETVVDAHILANNENITRYETEQEKSENLNAAQSLVQMSESIDHNINFVEINSENKGETDLNINELKKGDTSEITVEQKLALLSNESNIEQSNGKTVPYETTSSKLLKILEEPTAPKVLSNKTVVSKQFVMQGKEKILNFDVCNQSMRGKSQSPKQKIIIRRTTSNKNLLNNVNEVSSLDKIILSRSNKPVQDGSSVQTYTIQTSPEAPSDANTIIIQQKIRKMSKPSPKIQKTKPSTSLVAHVKEAKAITETATNEEPVFDINSMPVVLSDDILTPENIDKMPIVMSDGNIITNSTIPPKLVKTKSNIAESEKVTVNPVTTKAEIKTILMNPSNESNKVTTPNILSKSSKLRGAKPMLVIDKATGKQKIIMSKPEPVVKEVKQPTTTLIQTVPQGGGKAEKFIILPTPTSPRPPTRTQKIVIDPQTGKAHVLVGKGPEMTLGVSENKTVSAKLIPSSSDNNTPGNTVMIITNSQGGQSKIILTPEHEKILFPNKTNVSQLKSVTHRISTNSVIQQKSVVSTVTSALKGQTRIVPKQKNTIITSKGQLIVGGRVTTTTQNIAPMPEIRPALKRIVPAEPKKIIQTIQKDAPEPIIFFQRKSGAVMQLTPAQFEHLQRTGQLIHKTGHAQENKIVIQKSITVPTSEPVTINTPKQRARKGTIDSLTPMKKAKQEVPIAPAPGPASPMPALTSLSHTISASLPTVPSSTSIASASNYPDLENFEELLPSTAIARQPESVLIQPEQPVAPPQAAISDGQLLAVPGEHFGGLPGSFYLCVEDNGNYTIVDNRPLMLENNQLVPMAEPVPVIAPQPERRDILEAALANSDVFHAETARDEAPDFRDLNANVSVHCRVSETSTTLNQPIMTPVEVPTKADAEPAVPSNLEDGLAVIGVTPQTVPTSLELPITVTDPRIAPKTTNPLTNNNYGTSLLPSPNTDMTFVSTEEVEVPVGGPISMPLLTDEESVGKSMPILTDDVTERTVSSIESTVGSPSSVEVRESETEDSSQWSQRLLTPGSDTSETSSEIPLQPAIKLSVNDLSHSD